MDSQPEWVEIQPRYFLNDSTAIESPDDLCKETNVPEKQSFFCKYKIYIIIVVVILLLIIITLFIYYFHRSNNDNKLIIEENNTHEEIDIDEIKKLRNLRRMQKDQSQSQQETIVIIEPLMTTSPLRKNDFQNTNKIEVLDDENENIKNVSDEKITSVVVEEKNKPDIETQSVVAKNDKDNHIIDVLDSLISKN